MTNGPTTTVVVVDASVWISRLLPQDPNHSNAAAWLIKHLRSGGIITAPTMLALEVAASISRRTGSVTDAQAAASQLYQLPFVRLVPINQSLIAEATDLASALRLRGADAIYVAVAKQLGITLVTFDDEQLKRPVNLIATIRP